MNLQLERKRQDRRAELLDAIFALDHRHNARLALSDEYSVLPELSAYWKRQAEMSNRAAKRLYTSYQKLLIP